MDNGVIKYYVWNENERYCEFDDINEAIEYARENDCTKVELTEWYSEEAYQNYEPADRFETVWNRTK